MLSLGAFLLSCSLGTFPLNDYVFYGGDLDDERPGGLACERNTVVEDARTYDDFDLPQETTIRGLWANAFLTLGFFPKNAYYEIRSGVTEHNGGTLLASGDVRVAVMPTGRNEFNLDEYHIRASIPPITLPAGKYFATLAPVGFGYGRSFWSFARGEDNPPPGDPNPPPFGSPFGNGNSFFDSKTFGYNFETTEAILGGRPWDFSFGVGLLDTYARTFSLADSFTITRGVLGTGGVYELWGRDEKRLVIQQRFPFNVSSPSAQVQADTSSPVPRNPSGNRVTLTVWSRTTGAPPGNVIERIEMFDFTQNLWTVVLERPASNSDSGISITRTGGYVEPGTNRLLCRVGWFDRGVVNLGWSGQVDWILWDISP